jgi:hypothetical protein
MIIYKKILMLDNKKNNINLGIFFCALIIFLIRWYSPLINFDEKIDISIIFESISDGYIYFAPFKAFVNLDLNYSFDPAIENLNNITIPTGAFYLHFVFYHLLGAWSFVILELLFILFFLIIFYKISRMLNLTRLEALSISVILFNIPVFLEILGLSGTNYFTVIYSEFYSLRFPRPLVSNIFFYSFILCIFRLLKNDFFIKKNFILLGIISGLSFTSFFHVFVLEQLILFFILIHTYKNKSLKILQKNFKFIILYIVSFLIISLPFFINMFFTEPEFLERMGLADLNYERKLFLLSYLLKKIFKFEFLLIISLSIMIFFYINYIKNIDYFKKLNIFFIIFYTSILTPFIFVLLSPKFFSHFYLFNNVILISAFLLFFFSIFLIIKFYFIKIVSNKIINSIAILFIIIALSCNFYQNIKNYNETKLSEDSISLRNEFKIISNLIKENDLINLKDSSLLTFDDRFLIWATLNDIRYLKISNGVIFPKKNEMIEKDLIQAFKYLNLSKKDFHKFIENSKLSSWRYRNENIRKLFWMRYQANSLITYKNSKDFNQEILDFINKSSPLLSQQLIVPNNEIDRLLLKFDIFDSYTDNPDLIIINKKNKVLAKSLIDLKIFCKKFEGQIFIYYVKLTSDLNCN